MTLFEELMEKIGALFDDDEPDEDFDSEDDYGMEEIPDD